MLFAAGSVLLNLARRVNLATGNTTKVIPMKLTIEQQERVHTRTGN
jgi:hypothetical protein